MSPVTDGIHSALDQAKAGPGDRNVDIAGRAETVRQYLREGLVDELQLHVVPALLGAGLRPLRGAGCRTEGPGVRWVVETPLATHLNYRFVR
ncbi:dihydrofolate reductase family protein [Streptomyces lavendulae]|uniref:dihydrofolate reductase family protein n=1 Tax=Streptomyces lavendulae TaxID=1914 RepID=UPI0037FFA44E